MQKQKTRIWQLLQNKMRQFLAPTMPDSQGNLTLTGKDFRYLHQVLRLRIGDAIHVRLPSGLLQAMAVSAVFGKSLILSPCQGATTQETGVTATQVEETHSHVHIPLWLFQFMPKAQKLDVILRQATELGVDKVIPVMGAHCQKDAVFQRSDRWERIIREARQQSGSPVETVISKPLPLIEAMELWHELSQSKLGIVLYEKSQDTQSFHQAVGQVKIEPKGTPNLAALVSGCEGGFSPEEIETLKENGFIPVHLDTNILRAETATIYGLAVLQNLLTERPQWLLNESTC